MPRHTSYDVHGNKTLDTDISCILEPDGFFRAIDNNTYDCDCDQDGFFCTDHVGYGRTPLDAIVDLLDKKEEG
jgi:hypothetical protein